MRQTPAVEFLDKINKGVQGYGAMMNALLQQAFFELEKAHREIDGLVESNRSLKKRISELEKSQNGPAPLISVEAEAIETAEAERPEH